MGYRYYGEVNCAMVEKKEILFSNDVEIIPAMEALERLESHWLEQIDVSDDDYLYIKKEKRHLIVGKVELTFIE